MATCIFCGNNYCMEWKAIGFRTCLSCGDKSALNQIEEKKSRVTCAYNRSGLMYVADIKTTLDYKKERWYNEGLYTRDTEKPIR